MRSVARRIRNYVEPYVARLDSPEMTETEFASWRDIAIDQHGAQLSRAAGKYLDAAVEESRVLLSNVLPNGLRTDGMSLFAITEGDARIGWMWLGASPSDPAAGFVFDIIIEAEARGRGYGRAAMLAAEQFFRSQGKARVAQRLRRERHGARPLRIARLPAHLDVDGQEPGGLAGSTRDCRASGQNGGVSSLGSGPVLAGGGCGTGSSGGRYR